MFARSFAWRFFLPFAVMLIGGLLVHYVSAWFWIMLVIGALDFVLVNAYIDCVRE